MSQRTARRPFICIDLTSEEEVEEFDHDDDDEEDDEVKNDGEDEEEEGSDQTSSDDRSYEEEDSDDQDLSDNECDEEDEGLNVESLSKNVLRLLREGNDLRILTLQNCKAYLRKHGLRITGTKAVCLQRIIEHWRINDGNGQAFYPRSSFVVNCTGDVCKGDVVLFKQKVYMKFEKVTRSGRFLGKRTVAGRVVKESYGAARQQHTFTVEVLWSHGIKKLPPLVPLLVKGRNLYRLKTFRQRWKNEAERSRVLAEKHKRGAAARLVRERKKMKKAWSANEGTKRKTHCCRTRPSQARVPHEEMKHAYGSGKTVFLEHGNLIGPRQKALSVGQANFKHSTKSKPADASQRHQKPFFLDERRTAFQLHHSHTDFDRRRATSCFTSHELGSTSATLQTPPFRPYACSLAIPTPLYQRLPHGTYTHLANSNHIYGPARRSQYHIPAVIDVDRPIRSYPRCGDL